MGQKEDRLVTGPGVAIVSILYAGACGLVYIAWKVIRAIWHDTYYIGLYIVYSVRYLIAKRKGTLNGQPVLMAEHEISRSHSDQEKE